MRFLPQPVRQDFNFKVILPSLTYGLLIWGVCDKTIMENVEKLHYRAGRIIKEMSWSTPREELRIRLRWRPLSYFYENKLGMFVHSGTVGTQSQQDFWDMFNLRVSQYALRGSNVITTRNYSTNYGKRSISGMGATRWNSLPDSLRQITKDNKFRIELKKMSYGLINQPVKQNQTKN